LSSLAVLLAPVAPPAVEDRAPVAELGALGTAADALTLDHAIIVAAVISAGTGPMPPAW
jgi:hypothetical protein